MLRRPRSEIGVRVRTEPRARKTITRNIGKHRCSRGKRTINIPVIRRIRGEEMRFAACLALVLMAAAAAAAAGARAQAPSRSTDLTPERYRQMMDDRDYWRAQADRYERIERRARELRPLRRDQPLRDLNISDNEVREVEFIARQYLPRSMMNISPVVV